jgi:cobalt/nickel transport system permease protein
MGILAGSVGNATYGGVRRLLGESRGGQLASAAIGAWVSVMAAALATTLELALSGTTPLGTACPPCWACNALVAWAKP